MMLSFVMSPLLLLLWSAFCICSVLSFAISSNQQQHSTLSPFSSSSSFRQQPQHHDYQSSSSSSSLSSLYDTKKLLLVLTAKSDEFSGGDHKRNNQNEDDDHCDIAIFGGGFGGLYTALAISNANKGKNKALDIAIVDPSTNFVFLPLLYDLTIGTASETEVCPKYKDLLEGTNIRHIRASFDSYNDDSNNGNHHVLSSAYIQKKTNNDDGENNGAAAELSTLSFQHASIISVGATPNTNVINAVPGAMKYVQPFYTQEHVKETNELLLQCQAQIDTGYHPRIAVIGGGYAGVELAACIKRKLGAASHIQLLSKGPPMKGTRAESLINTALEKLGVTIESCVVKKIETEASKEHEDDHQHNKRFIVRRQSYGCDENETDNDEIQQNQEEPFDVIFWTAGSAPAYPVTEVIGETEEKLKKLRKTDSGRLAVDKTLRCYFKEDNDDGIAKSSSSSSSPTVWALGDCAEIVTAKDNKNAVPKTAQAAMQQADIVASNVLSYIRADDETQKYKEFTYQDLGTMLTLGGPNGILMAPKEGAAFAPLFEPLLDTTSKVLQVADELLLFNSPVAKQLGLTPILETLNLSLGGYGLGVGVNNATSTTTTTNEEDNSSSSAGTLAGTLTGAARRAIYAARMPTNKQRTFAAFSAALSTTFSIAKEVNDIINKEEK